MRVVAWATVVLAGLLALAFLLVFVDLDSTKIASRDTVAYVEMAIALILLCGFALVALRASRRVRRQPRSDWTTADGR
jgi:peptidoglycan/LPS O-acetylase OafA/YrhL